MPKGELIGSGSGYLVHYYDVRNGLVQMQQVFGILDQLRLTPQTYLSLGAGGLVEPKALALTYPSLDLITAVDRASQPLRSISANPVYINKAKIFPVLADASSLPFSDDARWDLITAKSFLHEYQSYTPDPEGSKAWIAIIRESLGRLAPDGVFYYLDFTGPDEAVIPPDAYIDITFNRDHPQADLAVQLYEAMKEHFRTFGNFPDHPQAKALSNLREPNASDFPPLQSAQQNNQAVYLPLGSAVEYLLHFRPWYRDNQKHLIRDKGHSWKELQEMYFFRDRQTGSVLTPRQQAHILDDCAKTAFGDKYRLYTQFWFNPDTDAFLEEFFSVRALDKDGNDLGLDTVTTLSQMTRKLIAVTQRMDKDFIPVENPLPEPLPGDDLIPPRRESILLPEQER